MQNVYETTQTVLNNAVKQGNARFEDKVRKQIDEDRQEEELMFARHGKNLGDWQD